MPTMRERDGDDVVIDDGKIRSVEHDSCPIAVLNVTN